MTIGAYEAKTHLPRLLDRVERGESLTITRRGRPVARLVPVEAHDRERAEKAARNLEKLRLRLRAEKRSVSIEEILASRHEGHRF